MADIIKPLNEIASSNRRIASSLSVSRTVLPEYVQLDSGDSPYTGLPSNLRSVTFVLWGIDVSNTVEITLPNSTILFNNSRYEGFSFTYSIDLDRDCSLSNDISVEIVGSAVVDVIYTSTISNS
jgi:hypothetical protein